MLEGIAEKQNDAKKKTDLAKQLSSEKKPYSYLG